MLGELPELKQLLFLLGEQVGGPRPVEVHDLLLDVFLHEPLPLDVRLARPSLLLDEPYVLLPLLRRTDLNLRLGKGEQFRFKRIPDKFDFIHFELLIQCAEPLKFLLLSLVNLLMVSHDLSHPPLQNFLKVEFVHVLAYPNLQVLQELNTLALLLELVYFCQKPCSFS